MIRLAQLQGPAGRRLAVVEEPHLILLSGWSSVYDLARACIERTCGVAELIGSLGAGERIDGERIDYDKVYAGSAEWRALPSADHPAEQARCLVSGTGLTHMGSARNRQAMHGKPEDLSDSMRMYRWGVEGGKPAAGGVGAAPEWFYKGNGTALRGHGEPLTIPEYADDGGEEAEIAGVYIIDPAGVPRRIGFTQGNEFSDHEFEKQNYLYLAASKLRECSIGPELAIGAEFASVAGKVRIERESGTLWSQSIRSGEQAMSHSLANLEHHHFKFAAHRRPGDVHIHFFGADAFSYGDGIRLQDGDFMEIHFEGFGRPLRNPVRRARGPQPAVLVQHL
jgi:hypothetical protein